MRGFKKAPGIREANRNVPQMRMVVSSDNWALCKKLGIKTPEELSANDIPFHFQYF